MEIKNKEGLIQRNDIVMQTYVMMKRTTRVQILAHYFSVITAAPFW